MAYAEVSGFLVRALNHLETATDMIKHEVPGADEQDDADERDFIAAARASLRSRP